MSPDCRSINLQDTCPDDVKQMLIKWSKDNFWQERHEYSELKRMLVARTHKKVMLSNKRTEHIDGEKQKPRVFFFFSSVVNEWVVYSNGSAGHGMGKVMKDVCNVAKKDTSITGCMSV